MHTALRFAFNTATVRIHNIPLDALIERVAVSGYNAIEPWADEIETYLEAGGDMNRLVDRIRELGLAVPNLISLAPWIGDTPNTCLPMQQRRLSRDLDLARQLGAPCMSAAPIGEPARGKRIPLSVVAERFGAVCRLGMQAGVTVLAENWAASANLQSLADAVYVATACGYPNAALLLDVYHLHKSNSGFEGLRLLSAEALPVFHISDYPSRPVASDLHVHHRLLPGEGAAPLEDIVANLISIGFTGYLSLELFPKTLERTADSLIVDGMASLRCMTERVLKNSAI